MKITEIFRRQPESLSEREKTYTLTKLLESLRKDGFTLSISLFGDLDRFGLVAGTVLCHDGNDGLRIELNEDGRPMVMVYNRLCSPQHPRHKQAMKYAGAVIKS